MKCKNFDFLVDRYYSTDDICKGIPLVYTLPRIEKAIKDILYKTVKDRDYRAKCKQGMKEVGPITEEGFEEEPDEILDERRLVLEPSEALTTVLDETFNYKSDVTWPEGETPMIEVLFYRIPKNKRYWYPAIGGRGLCEPEHLRARAEDMDYSSCQCPPKFKGICKYDIMQTLKAHALEDCIAEYNAMPKKGLKSVITGTRI